MRILWSCLLLIVLNWGLIACNSVEAKSPLSATSSITLPSKLSEAAPPKIIQELRPTLEQYQPQVAIVSPKNDLVFKDNQVEVKLQVKDLPVFQDSSLGIGPHLNLIVDNEAARRVYDLTKPIILENLAPGTHTLRAFAVRPWEESFKNEGAYAQTTFHVLTKTANNNPDISLPVLTYNSPQGTYGSEPVLLDFYLSNAPLHLIAEENKAIADWRVKVTINGESFLLDDWQSVYLKGLEPGNNWVQLEFIDDKGNNIDNAFNNTVRLITYEPKQKDSLSQLLEGKIPLEVARTIVDPNYKIPVVTPSDSQEKIDGSKPEDIISAPENTENKIETETEEQLKVEKENTSLTTIPQEKIEATQPSSEQQLKVEKENTSLTTIPQEEIEATQPSSEQQLKVEKENTSLTTIPQEEIEQNQSSTREESSSLRIIPQENQVPIASLESKSIQSEITTQAEPEIEQILEPVIPPETSSTSQTEIKLTPKPEVSPERSMEKPEWLKGILTHIPKLKVNPFPSDITQENSLIEGK